MHDIHQFLFTFIFCGLGAALIHLAVVFLYYLSDFLMNFIGLKTLRWITTRPDAFPSTRRSIIYLNLTISTAVGVWISIFFTVYLYATECSFERTIFIIVLKFRNICRLVPFFWTKRFHIVINFCVLAIETKNYLTPFSLEQVKQHTRNSLAIAHRIHFISEMEHFCLASKCSKTNVHRVHDKTNHWIAKLNIP